MEPINSTATLPAETWEYQPKDFSDAGNSNSFAAWVQGSLLHCPALGWLHWTGMRWQESEARAVDLAKQFTDQMLSDALRKYGSAAKGEPGGTAESRAKQYLAWAQKSRSAHSIKSMMELARPDLHVDLGALDANGYLLNTPAGIVDLRTGGLYPTAPGALCTKITEAAPATEGLPLWEDFLRGVTAGDEKLAGFLQQVAGMILTGVVRTEAAVILYGPGGNGKSTFLNALYSVLGSYAGSFSAELLTANYRQNRGAAFASLQGLRLAVGGELEQGARLSAATLKQLCSTDPILGERKYRSPESFTPSHTLILSTNYRFRVGSMDNGTWRRLLLVPFNADFSGHKERKNYAQELTERAGGAILQWAIDGAVLYNRGGGRLTIPDAVEELTDQYQAAEDWLQSFLDECTTQGAGKTQARVLYNHYRNYAESCGEYCHRESEFSDAMSAKGYRKLNSHGTSYWAGVVLRNDQFRPYYYNGTSS